MADRRYEERRTRAAPPPSLEDVERAYRELGAQTKYPGFIGVVVESVANILRAQACTFADRVTGQTWRFEHGDFEVRKDQAIANADASFRVGSGADLDAPFFDGQKTYALAPLERGHTVYGWLYVYAPADFTEAEQARFAALASFAAVVLENIRLIEAAERLAYTDTLTSLPNRRALENEMSRLVQAGRAFSYVMMDLDDFKAINDTRGHDAGDEALVAVAGALQAASRRNDVVGRLAGDEFVALIDGVVSDGFMQRVQDRLRGHGIGMSHGVARFPEDADNISALTKLGDDRLYETKRDRKSRRAMTAGRPMEATAQ